MGKIVSILPVHIKLQANVTKMAWKRLFENQGTFKKKSSCNWAHNLKHNGNCVL